MNVLDAVTLELEPTATYCRREIQFFPADDTSDGILIIRQWFRSFRRGTQRLNQESDLYQLIEADPPPGVMARAFALLNIADDSQELPYKVLVGRNRSCTCKGGRCKVPECKHESACEALIREGVL